MEPGVGRKLLHPGPQQLLTGGPFPGGHDAARSEALSYVDGVPNSAFLAV